MYRISTEHELTLEALCSQMLLLRLKQESLATSGLAWFRLAEIQWYTAWDISSSSFHDNILGPRQLLCFFFCNYREMHHVFSGLGGLVGKNQTYINVCVIPTLRIGQLLTLSWLLVMVGSSPQLCPTMRVPVRPLGVVYRWKREGMKGPQEPIPFTCLGNPMKHI